MLVVESHFTNWIAPYIAVCSMFFLWHVFSNLLPLCVRWRAQG